MCTLENTKSAVKGDPKKSGCSVEVHRKFEQVETGIKISLLGIDQKERKFTFARIEKKTLVMRLALQFYHGSLFDLRSSRYIAEKVPDDQAVKITK